MQSSEGIELELREIISEALERRVAPDDLPRDVPIFHGGIGLDSMSGLALMTAIEERFDVYIDDDQFDIFDSLDQLVEFVVQNRKGPEA